ncbi:hypothetical protein R69888_04428 [Paraburkholderia haematera]|uniref:Glycosyltransferase family 4 protein n=1 Tax=Paraburkholderia haematera TaxID=2793077 RepID=A0ABN7M3S1_9BURK|nr:hypothetical protein R69888_04428 [Paraburkholderia haematera]
MNVAIVHDWLVAPGVAEKVLEQIIECSSDADRFSLVDFLEDRRPLGGKPVTTSFIQNLPFARRRSKSSTIICNAGAFMALSDAHDRGRI